MVNPARYKLFNGMLSLDPEGFIYLRSDVQQYIDSADNLLHTQGETMRLALAMEAKQRELNGRLLEALKDLVQYGRWEKALRAIAESEAALNQNGGAR